MSQLETKRVAIILGSEESRLFARRAWKKKTLHVLSIDAFNVVVGVGGVGVLLLLLLLLGALWGIMSGLPISHKNLINQGGVHHRQSRDPDGRCRRRARILSKASLISLAKSTALYDDEASCKQLGAKTREKKTLKKKKIFQRHDSLQFRRGTKTIKYKKTSRLDGER